MKTQALLIGTVIAVAAALPAFAHAASKPRNITFIASQTSSQQTRTSAVVRDIDYVGTDAIGHSITSCKATQNPVRCVSTISLKAGTVVARWNVNSNLSSHGQITGGTGAYANAKGTIAIKILNRAATRGQVTLRFA